MRRLMKNEMVFISGGDDGDGGNDGGNDGGMDGGFDGGFDAGFGFDGGFGFNGGVNTDGFDPSGALGFDTGPVGIDGQQEASMTCNVVGAIAGLAAVEAFGPAIGAIVGAIAVSACENATQGMNLADGGSEIDYGGYSDNGGGA